MIQAASGRRAALTVALVTLTFLVSSCARIGSAVEHARATGQASPVPWPGPCRGLVMPQTAVVQREPASDASAAGFPLKNLSPFRHSIAGSDVTRQLLFSACGAVPATCNFISTLPSTVLNGYIVTFFYGKERVATLVGTPSLPCGTLFLIKGGSGPSPADEGAPFGESYPGWIDLHGNAQSFFGELASALRVPISSLRS